MHILQAGVAKSGNYWLWKIIHNTLNEAKVDIKSHLEGTNIVREIESTNKLSHTDQAKTDVLDVDLFGYKWRISSFYSEKIEDINQYISACTHIWTHSEYSSNFHEVFKGVDKIVYIIRDPRDIAISMANFAFTDYVQAAFPHKETSVEEYLSNRIEWQTSSWNKHTSGWLANAPENMHVIFYENLKQNFDEEYKHLLDFLGITLTPDQIKTVKESVTITNMKKKNPDHVRSGKAGGWQNKLTNSQISKVDRSCGELLSELGYSRSSTSPSEKALVWDRTNKEYKRLYSNSNLSFRRAIRALRELLFGKRKLSDKIKVIWKKLLSLLYTKFGK